jgi:hypothetical protein
VAIVMNQHYWHDVIQRLGINDKGAWLVYLFGVIFFFLCILLKKRITWREWYVTFGVVGFFAWMVDIVLFYQLDLLDSGRPDIGEVPDIVMFAIAPSSIAILYLNYYNPKRKWTVGLLFTVCSLLIEYLLVKAGFLIQKGWHIWYSIPAYLFMFFVFLPLHLQVIRGEKKIHKAEEITQKPKHYIFFLNFLFRRKRAR